VHSFVAVLLLFNNEIKQASESYLESMQQEFYLTGIKELFDKCNLCIAATGDYVE